MFHVLFNWYYDKLTINESLESWCLLFPTVIIDQHHSWGRKGWKSVVGPMTLKCELSLDF